MQEASEVREAGVGDHEGEVGGGDGGTELDEAGEHLTRAVLRQAAGQRAQQAEDALDGRQARQHGRQVDGRHHLQPPQVTAQRARLTEHGHGSLTMAHGYWSRITDYPTHQA